MHFLGRNVYLGLYNGLVSVILGHAVLFGSNFALRTSAWERLRERVHRHDKRVHDDVDIAVNLLPSMESRFDSSLVVGLSARPFRSWSNFWKKVTMFFETMYINNADESLWRRRRMHRLAARAWA
ncbi:hypothetical protein [uncultured Corynebacterium sp.]|uniref:hypothetical protein n=1 Tax=uncultured Corynebacterium sp. TaxID=159447 RepID=UPI0025D18D5B|nr:hypothetical protein [uncultured Corynebacterium sp.]